MNNEKKTAMEIMSQLSQEEIVSLVVQDYSALIKFLELRAKLFKEELETKNPVDRVTDEIIAMALDTLKDFLKDVNNIGRE